MRKPTLTTLRDSMPSSQTGQAAFDSGLATRASVRPPIGEPGNVGSSSWLALPALFDEHGGCNAFLPSPAKQVLQCNPCLHIGVASDSSSPEAVSPQCDRGSVPKASHHAFGPRSRLGTEGFHVRRRERFVWSHFFPRSVGFGPTASRAIGAFTMAPSMLCHDHAIPSISSYSANPLRQSFTKTPFFFHSRKYLCTELALPNSDFGKAFHWHPVRKTYTMPSSTLRGSMGFRPPPGRRKYLCFLSRRGFEMSGLACSQKSSEIVHDLMAFMQHIYTIMTPIWQAFIYG
jgi:hypothetical protein